MSKTTYADTLEAIANHLLERAKSVRTKMNGIPFGATGKCDCCEGWVPYNDRMGFRESEDGPEVILCFWCSMHATDPKTDKGIWKPNLQQVQRMCEHIAKNIEQ